MLFNNVSVQFDNLLWHLLIKLENGLEIILFETSVHFIQRAYRDSLASLNLLFKLCMYLWHHLFSEVAVIVHFLIDGFSPFFCQSLGPPLSGLILTNG
jgi:hypothetical protein